MRTKIFSSWPIAEKAITYHRELGNPANSKVIRPGKQIIPSTVGPVERRIDIPDSVAFIGWTEVKLGKERQAGER